MKVDQIDEAEAAFAMLFDESADNPRVLLGMGMVFSRRERWHEAVPLLKKASEHPTARRSGPVALSAVYARLGDTVAAEAENKRATDAAADVPWPDPILAEVERKEAGLQPRIDRGLRLIREGQVDEAEEILTALVRNRPESDEAHLTLAKAYIRQNRMTEAETRLREAIAINPGLVESHFLLGGVCMVRQDFAAAEQSYVRAIDLRPTYAAAYFALGGCNVKTGKNSAAMQAFRDAVRCRPDFAAAHIELAELLLKEGKVDEAIVHVEDALRTDQKSDRARKLLEQARCKSGK